jgi:hypothetical protein
MMRPATQVGMINAARRTMAVPLTAPPAKPEGPAVSVTATAESSQRNVARDWAGYRGDRKPAPIAHAKLRARQSMSRSLGSTRIARPRSAGLMSSRLPQQSSYSALSLRICNGSRGTPWGCADCSGFCRSGPSRSSKRRRFLLLSGDRVLPSRREST